MSRGKGRLAEGHALQDTAKMTRKPDSGKPAPRPLVDAGLAGQLLGKARAGGVELPGPDGLLSRVAKAVPERALAGEMTGHLGYEQHDPAGRGSGSSRTGTAPQSVLAGVGAAGLAVPRDGTAGPQIGRKGADPAGRVQRPDHRAVRARHEHPRHPR
jgi:hypothetical protein